MKYFIKTSYTSNNTIGIHAKDIEKYSLDGFKTIVISMGAVYKEVTLTKHHQEECYLYMSSDILADFSLPDFLQYEIRVDEGVLYIGPVIGLLIRGKIDEMTKQRIKIYKNYLNDYKHVNGLVLLITTDGIDLKSKTISGYVYHPKENEWIKGKYPFPAAVFCGKRSKNQVERNS